MMTLSIELPAARITATVEISGGVLTVRHGKEWRKYTREFSGWELEAATSYMAEWWNDDAEHELFQGIRAAKEQAA